MHIHSRVTLSVLVAPAIVLSVLPFLLDSAFACEPLTTSQQVNSTSPVLVAQQSRVRRIQFEAGKNSAVVKDAVLRGTRDIYLLNAQRGQIMTVKIFSLGNNAEFDLAAPSNKAGQRRVLKSEAVTWTGPLPASGDYQIIVGSARGNSSYQLQVTIK